MRFLLQGGPPATDGMIVDNVPLGPLGQLANTITEKLEPEDEQFRFRLEDGSPAVLHVVYTRVPGSRRFCFSYQYLAGGEDDTRTNDADHV